MKKIWLWIGMAMALIGVSITSYQQGKKDINRTTVTRIIDGDTIEVGNNTVRLLGINSPEKGEIGYNEAKAFLQAVSGGAERVQVGVMNLTRWYKYLVPVKGLNNQGLPPELPKISDQQRTENRNRIKLLKEKFKP